MHDWLTGMRGGEKVLEELAVLFPTAPIYTLFHFPGSVSETLERHSIHTSFLQKAPGLRRWYRHYLPFYPAAAEDLDLVGPDQDGHDLVVSSSHCVAKGVLSPPGSFHACYIHTPMRYAWDQERQYFPRRTGLVARVRALILSALRAWDVTSSRRVDLYLANSRFVAERVRRYYRREAEVVHPPVDVDFFQPSEDPDAANSYCLIVAALAPYKRLDVAIRACESLGVPLRIVGTGPEEARLRRLAGSNTRFLGRVDGDDLRRLYQGARCLLQPGVEDFGIAPVEALACGTPVVARGRGGVLDIVKSGVHGVLYEPPPEAARNDVGTAATEVDAMAHEAALRAAIDKLGEIQFNILNLRSRAEDFSAPRFRRLIWSSISEGLSRAQNL